MHLPPFAGFCSQLGLSPPKILNTQFLSHLNKISKWRPAWLPICLVPLTAHQQFNWALPGFKYPVTLHWVCTHMLHDRCNSFSDPSPKQHGTCTTISLCEIFRTKRRSIYTNLRSLSSRFCNQFHIVLGKCILALPFARALSIIHLIVCVHAVGLPTRDGKHHREVRPAGKQRW